MKQQTNGRELFSGVPRILRDDRRKPRRPGSAALLRQLRKERRISKRQLADNAGVNVSVVLRAERGVDARLSTWEKLFEGLGWILTLNIEEQCEEAADLLSREAGRRYQRRHDGLCAGKRRFY